MTYLPISQKPPFLLDAKALNKLGSELHEAHASAAPFPHSVIDDFVPMELVRYCQEHFPQETNLGGMEFDRDQERFKRSFQPDTMDAELRMLFYAFNSAPFVPPHG